MPRGVYPHKPKGKRLPMVIEHLPLDAIPERPTPVQRVNTRSNYEALLLSLCHRQLDVQERLMDMLPSPKRGKYKKASKTKN